MAAAKASRTVILELSEEEAEFICALFASDLLAARAKETVWADKLAELHGELDAVLPNRELTYSDFFEEES